MTPSTLRIVQAALTRFCADGLLFSSRTRLSEHVAVSTGLSSRTVRRAFDLLEIDHLIGHADLPAVGQTVRHENGHLPGPGQTVRQPPDSCPTPERETPGQTAPAVVASRAHAPARTQLTPGTPPPGSPPAAPAGAAPSPPPDPAPQVRRFTKRVRRIVNVHAGVCVCCGWWVDEEAGFIPVPYPDTAPTPLHCAECWAVFDALDQAMASPSGPQIGEPS